MDYLDTTGFPRPISLSNIPPMRIPKADIFDWYWPCEKFDVQWEYLFTKLMPEHNIVPVALMGEWDFCQLVRKVAPQAPDLETLDRLLREETAKFLSDQQALFRKSMKLAVGENIKKTALR